MNRKKEQMYSLVAAWQSGEASKKVYCEAHQINLHTFTYWVQKYKVAISEEKEERSNQKFIPLQVSTPQELSDSSIELSYPNGVRLRVASVVSISYLESLIKITI